MKFIDDFLNQITMYRLVFYYLILLIVAAVIYSALGILAFNPLALIFSSLFLFAVCLITNKIFSYVFKAPANIESTYITALILALIISPSLNINSLPLLFWAAVLSTASKYILAHNHKHIFNPAAFAVFILALTGIGSASWWIGTFVMLPFTLLGVLIVRKIRRFDLVFYFFVFSLLTIVGLSLLRGSDPLTILWKTIADSPIIFFAFIMLTEPLTTPPTKTLQSIYGSIVGFLFSPQLTFGGLYTTPEIALLIGNIFSYIVSPKQKLMLTLKNKIEIGDDIVHFIFNPVGKFAFTPGQYLEWTLPHKGADSRGDRRYFTIASSPTEENISIGVKFYNNGSSFKKALDQFGGKKMMAAGSLTGDFILPKDASKKLVFIAGGIGVTPFRSIIKYLIDKGEKRDIVLFYANKIASEIAYKDVFDMAAQNFGLKTVYTLTDEASVPKNWKAAGPGGPLARGGRAGRISLDMIKQEVPDFAERTFYLSGPHVMVDAYKEVLKQMGVHLRNIVIDYFPGYV